MTKIKRRELFAFAAMPALAAERGNPIVDCCDTFPIESDLYSVGVKVFVNDVEVSRFSRACYRVEKRRDGTGSVYFGLHYPPRVRVLRNVKVSIHYEWGYNPYPSLMGRLDDSYRAFFIDGSFQPDIREVQAAEAMQLVRDENRAIHLELPQYEDA